MKGHIGRSALSEEEQAHYWRLLQLVKEQDRFTYLPAKAWLEAGGYQELAASQYKYMDPDGIIYRLTMLSRTGMLLLFRDEQYVGARVVEGDEAFLRLLIEHGFPLPV